MIVSEEITRPKVWLRDGWRFKQEKAGRAWLSGRERAAGDSVLLPHCWNARDSFQDGVAYYRGPGAYQRMITIPEAPSNVRGRWHLKSEGFYGTGEVWLNGSRLAKVDGEYLGFDIDLGDLAAGSEHHVGIALTNKCSRHVLPGIKMPDFLLYGGLTGRVFLQYVPDTRVDLQDVHVTSKEVGTDASHFSVSAGVTGHAEGEIELEWTLRDGDGSEIQKVTVGPSAEGVCQVDLPLAEPRRWSVEDPHRYTLGLRLTIGEHVHDGWTLQVGFRDACFTREGFFLNGERVLLQGWNRHEDIPGFGRGLLPVLQRADAQLLKDAGGNFVRLSHYPEHPEFLDECDRLGILVYAEIATWKSVREGRWLENALRQFRGMILRDRNHPSVVLWGMGNESRSYKGYTRMNALVQELDPERPTIYAENHIYRGRRKNTLGLPDVFGVNYELDCLDEAVEVSKNGAILVSECSNNPQAWRGDLEEEWKQVQIIVSDWAMMDAHSGNSGYSLWCMNDYATLRKERYKRYSGLVDAWRVPKLAYRLLQARCLTRPVLEGAVQWDAPGGDAQLYVITNCEQIQITGGDDPVSCDAMLAMRVSITGVGEVITVHAVYQGEPVTREFRRWGDPVALRVLAESGDVPIDQEVSVFTVDVLDADGRRVETWHGDIQVHVEGPASGVFYSPTDTVPVRAGTGRVFVRHTGASGCVDVRVSAAGLADGQSRIELA